MKLTNTFEVELENGKVCTVEVEAFGNKEPYGADADGNRGEMRFFVTDEEAVEVICNQPISYEETKEAEELALLMATSFNWEELFNEAEEES